MKINKKLLKAQKLISNGYYADAIKLLNEYIKNFPDDFDCLMLRGEAFLRDEKFEEALIDYAKVVEKNSKNILALNNFSLALIGCNRYSEAKEIINHVLTLHAGNFPALINLGTIHQALGEFKEGVIDAMKALEQQPQSHLAYQNLGTALSNIEKHEEAREAFKIVITLDSNNILAYINLAKTEESLGNITQAKAYFEKILQFNNLTSSQSDLVKYYLSYIYLNLGYIKKGWEYYDLGFNATLPSMALRSARKFIKPRWNGNLNEKGTILIWREQGLGDEIVFSTCLQDLHDLKMDIIVECDERLVGILARTYSNFKVRRESFDPVTFLPIYDDFDYDIPIGSLPRYLRNSSQEFDKAIPSWMPLIQKRIIIEKKIEPYKQKILVGICWRSGLLNLMRNDNYTSLLDWKELLVDKNLQFVNLQYGECESEILEAENIFNIRILRWSDIDLKNDIESVLALCAQLDIVCTVGTAVSSIAGASGTPTLLLVKKSWILLGQQLKYPWYPNVRPFVASNSEHVASNIKNLKHHIKKKLV